MEKTGETGHPQYHDTSASYALPNDSPEHQRLELQATALEKLMHGQVFHAPLNHPRRILDVGCGTGQTTVRLAAQYPDATVIGIDISPVPTIHDRPDNVEYVQGDFHELAGSNDERFRSGSFDCIFHRLLVFGITDWPAYFKLVAKMLVPGGYAEAQEVDITLRDLHNNATTSECEAQKAFHYLAGLKGMDLGVGSRLKMHMESVGLESVGEQTYFWPILPMPEMPETDMVQKLTAKLPVAMQAIWDRLNTGGVLLPEKLEECRRGLMLSHGEDVREKGDHYNFNVVWARKRSVL